MSTVSASSLVDMRNCCAKLLCDLMLVGRIATDLIAVLNIRRFTCGVVDGKICEVIGPVGREVDADIVLHCV